MASATSAVSRSCTWGRCDAIFNVLQPDGVVVELEAEHLCMTMRGINKPGTRVLTSATRGEFENYPPGREGLLALMHSR